MDVEYRVKEAVAQAVIGTDCRWWRIAWDVPLTRHWEHRCWPGAWSPTAGRWVRL